MSGTEKISRRRFIQKAVIAGAGIAGFPMVFIPKSHAAWARQTNVHPNVDNLRVVSITDNAMTRGVNPNADWSRQNELVDSDVVWDNMDKLAGNLTGERTAAEAWQAIFIKPPRKSWSDTVVAIKTNNIAQQHTRSAVMAKICHTLTGTLGVKPGNIHIYDACHGASMARDTPFAGLPEGCRIEDRWGGSRTYTSIPEPWQGRDGRSQCLKHLVNGSVDILVNISMCKGHSSRFGGFTMTMKNHFGTFSPGPGHSNGSQEYLLAINQTPEILGAMDRGTGKVLYPRQQLCIVDALWSSRGGPGGNPTHQTNFLAMGVMSPIVDYQVATKFRGERMGWQPNVEMTRRMLTEFGYSESDLPEGGKLIQTS
ncbi:DUF362 domain-containing protein [Thermodesulfobacteriota bacterium]